VQQLAVLKLRHAIHPALSLQLDDPIGAYQREQARLQEVRDRLGPLFMDLRGTSRARLMAGWAGAVGMAARGMLLGAFAGECVARRAAR
jgi:hypothetical protein